MLAVKHKTKFMSPWLSFKINLFVRIYSAPLCSKPTLDQDLTELGERETTVLTTSDIHMAEEQAQESVYIST